MTLDIIIPTYNSADTIALTLEALFAQHVEAAATAHLIISDDGSTDDTLRRIEKIRPLSPWRLTVLPGRHAGVAAARNRAVSISAAPLLLLLGADILLRPGALAVHLQFHHHYPEARYAALGHIGWDPRLPPSPFMEWMTHGGPQNNFDALLGHDEAEAAHYLYGSHLSLKRSFLGQDRWQEAFQGYGWEDIELGRRLAARGLVLKTLFAAQALHHHAYTTGDIVRRQRAAGEALGIYQRLHPAVPLLPPRSDRACFKMRLWQWSGLLLLLRVFLAVTGQHLSTPRLFSWLTTVEYWQGILRAQLR